MNFISRAILTVVFLILQKVVLSQAFPLNSFFTDYSAITFYSSDSNNFILNEISSYNDLKSTIKKEFPFSIKNAEQLNDIIPFNVFTPISGLHSQVPNFDTILQEIKGVFALDTFVKNWYAYYNKSKVDTTTAFLIIPGSGFHNSWGISSGDTGNYHNKPLPIKNKCLEYGDVYTYVKPNEDFRNIWKSTSAWDYMKLNYGYLTPYTDFHGINWAANMQIECVAAIKCLKLKYNKVIVLGLSSGGLPALIAGLEGEADGIHCASGLSVTSYDGFLLSNFENPYFYNQFKKYSLDSLKTKIDSSSSYFLFSYGALDYGTNAYEYDTHSLQDTLATLNKPCFINFTYNFSGHHFPVMYLDSFFNKVKNDSCYAPLLLLDSSHDDNLIKIYPNPVQKNIFIKSDEAGIESVQLFSFSGQEIIFNKYQSVKTVNIGLPTLPSGNYIINIISNQKNYAKIISIQQE